MKTGINCGVGNSSTFINAPSDVEVSVSPFPGGLVRLQFSPEAIRGNTLYLSEKELAWLVSALNHAGKVFDDE